jgi:hypothetical protein
LASLDEMAARLREVADWIDGLGKVLGGLEAATLRGVRRPRGARAAKAAAVPAAPRRRGRRGTLAKEIVALLQNAKAPMMPAAIRTALKAKATSVSTTLNRLAKAGTVKRDKNGKGWTA